MTFHLGTRSLSNLTGVHPSLVNVMHEAIKNSPHDFTITEGVRSKERQKELFDKKLSQTMNSRHLTGHAVDIALIKNGKACWDVQLFEEVILHIQFISKGLEVPLVFGGHWKTFKDWPHIELDRKVFP